VPLAEYGISERAEELSRAAAALAKEVASDYSTPDRPRWVAGSIGPGTKMPTLGHISFADLRDAYEVQARGLLEGGQPLIVTVDVRREEESLRLTVQKIEPLDTIVAQAAAGLRIFVSEAEALPRLKSVISREAGGRGRVTVVLDLPSREIEVALPGGFRVDPRIRAAVKSLPGIVDVHDI
jgi:hypothetical protein